ncbi:hypothetical protein [Streptomyces fructofermentans]|uniref:hypothetical protein n=1 Tax=Streptomyces fructofermentans TaxID=152141 RepID=UPI001677C14C|nr:hypothetical protein [Streptomyces fructofermentans]
MSEQSFDERTGPDRGLSAGDACGRPSGHRHVVPAHPDHVRPWPRAAAATAGRYGVRGRIAPVSGNGAAA